MRERKSAAGGIFYKFTHTIKRFTLYTTNWWYGAPEKSSENIGELHIVSLENVRYVEEAERPNIIF